MNKPQYLAELNQLLIFMTRADREQTVARCGALFDRVGPDGEKALLDRLGSPTRLAIRMSRTYEPGHVTDEQLESLEAEPSPSPEPEPAPSSEPAGPKIASLIEDDLPVFDLPDLPDVPAPETPAPVEEAAAPADEVPPTDTQPAPEPEEAGEEADEYEELWGKRPQPAPQPGPDDEDKNEDEYSPDEAEDISFPPEDDGPAPVQYAIQRTIPLWAGIPLFILALVLLVIPLTVVGIVLIPIFVLPGLAVLLGAWLAVVGGLWCISIIADAAVLFGVALILLALGLIVLWCGLWLDVNMVQLYTRALRGLSHLTLGRKVIVHAQ